MTALPAVLRPYVARVLAAWIAALSGWASNTIGVEIAIDDQAALVNVALGVALTVYAVAHKLLNAKLNPADAATPAKAEASVDR